jgi:hypothetical protein
MTETPALEDRQARLKLRGPLAACFPPGLSSALGDVEALRSEWLRTWPDSKLASDIAHWLTLQLKGEYARGLIVRDHALRKRRRRDPRTSCWGESVPRFILSQKRARRPVEENKPPLAAVLASSVAEPCRAGLRRASGNPDESAQRWDR